MNKQPLITVVSSRIDYRLLCTVKRVRKNRVEMEFSDGRRVNVEEGDSITFSWSEEEK